MSFILYFIRKIISAHHYPTKILLYFASFDIRKSSNLNNFKHFVIKNQFLESALKKDLCDIFYLFQKYYRTLCRFSYHCKIKRTKHTSASTDLRSVPLYTYPPHQKIQLYIDNTIYHFRLSDLIMMWKNALTHSSYMDPAPRPLSNPYTNIPFKMHNLYNIYLKIHFSNLHCDYMIADLFKLDFNMRDFKIKFYPQLRDIALSDFAAGGDVNILFEDVISLFSEYKFILKSAEIDKHGNNDYKEKIVKKTRELIKLYYLCNYSHNPLFLKECARRLKVKLIVFEDYNRGFGKEHI